MCQRISLLSVLCLGSAAAIAQQAPGPHPSWSFDFAGELRERAESVDNPVFGLASPAHNDYLLHRAVLSGELRRDDDFRAFVELVSGLTSGWTGSPPPTQDDALDLLQAYIEPSLTLAGSPLAIRLGRQELSLGASRLVSIREGPNIRRAFDGVRAIWTRDERSVNAFFVRPVFPEEGVFDDRSSSGQRFWGLYATWPAARIDGLAFDAYYLGLDREEAEFAAGVARERRHTVGVRAFGERTGWDWNIEGAWQWGSFGESSIRAWTVSVDAGYEFSGLPLSPRVGLKADAISGDQDLDDQELGTFNPLFPRLPYFSEANLATPANLLDLQPNLHLSVSETVGVQLSWDGLWKHEAADAFYAPPLVPIDGTSMTQSRDIGWQASLLIEWQVTEQLEATATYVSFEPRAVTLEAQGRAGDFLAAWVQWRF